VIPDSRLHGTGESAKVHLLAIDPNLSPVFSALVQGHALEPGPAIGAEARIAVALKWRRFPKIRPAVVGAGTVDMIGLAPRPVASHPQKHNAVSHIAPTANANSSITLATKAPGHIANMDAANPSPPRKSTGFWLVL
jgi:hypothetical protein